MSTISLSEFCAQWQDKCWFLFWYKVIPLSGSIYTQPKYITEGSGKSHSSCIRSKLGAFIPVLPIRRTMLKKRVLKNGSKKSNATPARAIAVRLNVQN